LIVASLIPLQYETCRAYWNLLDVFDRYQLPATLFVCGRSAEVFPEYVIEAESRGWEVVSESYRFLEYFGMDPKTEAEHASKALDAISKASTKGTVPTSYYMARPSHLSEGFAVEAFKKKGVEMSYSNCAYGDDLPYYGVKNGILYVPMSLDCNDQSELLATLRIGLS
jgi:peptidoglycan/xylan/chitin deacetylase (PgdA/CDA1 family)